MEIMSPVLTTPSPSAPFCPEANLPPILPPPTPASSPSLPLSPLQSPDLIEPSPISFTAQPSDAPFIVALGAQIPRRDSPFKHKATRKTLFTPQIQNFSTLNPFSILDPATTSFQNQLSPLNPSQSPLLPAPVGSLLPQEENTTNNL